MSDPRIIIPKDSKPLASGVEIGILRAQQFPGTNRYRFVYHRPPPEGPFVVGCVNNRKYVQGLKGTIDKVMREVIDPGLTAQGNYSAKDRLDLIKLAYKLGLDRRVDLSKFDRDPVTMVRG